MSQSAVKTLGPLDEIRGTAALAVFFIHYIQIFYNTSDLGVIGVLSKSLGTWGVSIFFVLSGYLIHLGALKEFERNQEISWKKYFLRRFFRIYPPFLICLLASFFIGLYHQSNMITKSNFWDLIAHVTMISSYFVHFYHSINAIFWTVIVEVHFYVFYPIVWFLLTKKSIQWVFIATFLMGLFYFIITYLLTEPGYYRMMHQHTPITLFWKWVLGVVLADLYWKKSNAWVFNIFNMPGMIVVVIFLSFIPQVVLGKSISLQYERFVLPFVSFAFIGVLVSERMKNYSNNVLKWVGKVSYSLYLWHPIVLLIIIPFCTNGGWLCLSLTFLASILVAWLSFVTTENTSMQLGKRILAKMKL